MSKENESLEDKLKNMSMDEIIQYRALGRLFNFAGHVVGIFSGICFAFSWPVLWAMAVAAGSLVFCAFWCQAFSAFADVINNYLDLRYPGWEDK